MSLTGKWLPIDSNIPDEVMGLVKYAIPPKLGQHIGRTYTMADGRWIVLRHQTTGSAWQSYMILPAPPP